MSSRLQKAMDDEPRGQIPGASSSYGIKIPSALPSSNTADYAALIPDKKKRGVYHYKGCRITPTGVEIPKNTPKEVWDEIGAILLDMESSISFALGDWLAFGEDRTWGETYKTMAEERGLKVETLHSYASVCRKVLIRNQGLSFAHHRKVMALKNPDSGESLEGDELTAHQTYWLNQAAANRWSVSQLDEAINGRKTPPALSDPVGYAQRRLTNLWEELPPIKELDSGYCLQIAELLEQLAHHYRNGAGE